MTDLMPVEAVEADLVADPVAYMTMALHRAKGWLEEVQNIDDVRNAKAIAAGYETVIQQKELAFDAQLAATEIVRRCERRVGELVREGQAEGTIAKPGDIGVTVGGAPRGVHLARPADLIPSGNERQDVYTFASTPAADFDAAIEEAKAEGNLSRANVVRKVKGEAPKSDRSEWHHKKRHIDPMRIAERLAEELEAATAGLDLVPDGYLPSERKLELITSINQSIDTIRKAVKKW